MTDEAIRHFGWLGWLGLLFGTFGGGAVSYALTRLFERR